MMIFSQCAEECGIRHASLLDIGGTAEYWETHLQNFPSGIIKEIEVVNVIFKETLDLTICGVRVCVHAGDALDQTTLIKNNYDIVYSNSVIEHVGSLSNQKRMADAVRNVCQFYFVQTPAKGFPIEPHFYFPFFAQLPLSFRALLHQKMDLGFMPKTSDWLQARIDCEDTRLLTHHEFSELFPNARILKESLFGFTKSYMATNMVA